jgi:hypothetical protein
MNAALLLGPQNNKMQLTRSGHPRWRPSPLILVFYGRNHAAPEHWNGFAQDTL